MKEYTKHLEKIKNRLRIKVGIIYARKNINKKNS